MRSLDTSISTHSKQQERFRTKRRLALCVPFPRQNLAQCVFKFLLTDGQALFRAVPSDAQSIAKSRSRGAIPQSEDMTSPHIQLSGIGLAYIPIQERQVDKESTEKEMHDGSWSEARRGAVPRFFARTAFWKFLYQIHTSAPASPHFNCTLSASYILARSHIQLPSVLSSNYITMVSSLESTSSITHLRALRKLPAKVAY